MASTTSAAAAPPSLPTSSTGGAIHLTSLNTYPRLPAEILSMIFGYYYPIATPADISSLTLTSSAMYVEHTIALYRKVRLDKSRSALFFRGIEKILKDWRPGKNPKLWRLGRMEKGGARRAALLAPFGPEVLPGATPQCVHLQLLGLVQTIVFEDFQSAQVAARALRMFPLHVMAQPWLRTHMEETYGATDKARLNRLILPNLKTISMGGVEVRPRWMSKTPEALAVWIRDKMSYGLPWAIKGCTLCVSQHSYKLDFHTLCELRVAPSNLVVHHAKLVGDHRSDRGYLVALLTRSQHATLYADPEDLLQKDPAAVLRKLVQDLFSLDYLPSVRGPDQCFKSLPFRMHALRSLRIYMPPSVNEDIPMSVEELNCVHAADSFWWLFKGKITIHRSKWAGDEAEGMGMIKMPAGMSAGVPEEGGEGQGENEGKLKEKDGKQAVKGAGGATAKSKKAGDAIPKKKLGQIGGVPCCQACGGMWDIATRRRAAAAAAGANGLV
ncbi:hypothetical protein IAT38_005315 [Cryptococcus sp. DSM 104549]